MQKLTVYAPASSGNLSVGFDALGLALAPLDGTYLGDLVHLIPSNPDDWELSLSGPFADSLPQDQEQNIVISSCRIFQETARLRGVKVRPLRVELQKNLPVGSGLGSSASSIVATLVALNRFYGRPLNRPLLLKLMADMEGSISGAVHLDNIAPSLLGGLRLCTPGSAQQYALPWPASWRVVVAWPGTMLNTRESREGLPEMLPRDLTVRHGAQFAKFVHELHVGEARAAATCMVDLIAEPHRARLLPGFEEARIALMNEGALAVGISGSGPAIFCIMDDYEIARDVKSWLEANYLANEMGFVHICRADLAGARQIQSTH